MWLNREDVDVELEEETIVFSSSCVHRDNLIRTLLMNNGINGSLATLADKEEEEEEEDDDAFCGV